MKISWIESNGSWLGFVKRKRRPFIVFVRPETYERRRFFMLSFHLQPEEFDTGPDERFTTAYAAKAYAAEIVSGNSA